jgi:hypothetical protein
LLQSSIKLARGSAFVVHAAEVVQTAEQPLFPDKRLQEDEQEKSAWHVKREFSSESQIGMHTSSDEQRICTDMCVSKSYEAGRQDGIKRSLQLVMVIMAIGLPKKPWFPFSEMNLASSPLGIRCIPMYL